MKISDKDAIEQVKAILKDCSPAARKAIQTLVLGGTQPMAPAARSMNKDSVVKVPEMPHRIPPKTIDVNKEVKSAPGSSDDDDWLNNWVKR